MKKVSITLTFLFMAVSTFAQQEANRDTTGHRNKMETEYYISKPVLNDIRRMFESNPMAPQPGGLLIDISLPTVKPEMKYPVLYIDTKFENALPDITEIDYKRGYRFSKQTGKFSFNEYSFATQKTFSIDSNISYQLHERLALDFIRKHYSNVYNNPLLPTSADRDQFGMGLSLKITPRLTFKTGFEYVLNQMSNKWEWRQVNTLNYRF